MAPAGRGRAMVGEARAHWTNLVGHRDGGRPMLSRCCKSTPAAGSGYTELQAPFTRHSRRHDQKKINTTVRMRAHEV